VRELLELIAKLRINTIVIIDYMCRYREPRLPVTPAARVRYIGLVSKPTSKGAHHEQGSHTSQQDLPQNPSPRRTRALRWLSVIEDFA